MAWTRPALARCAAVLRAWGLVAALGSAAALALLALVAGDVYVELPVMGRKLTVLHLLPVLTAMAVSFPLVDRTPDLTLQAGRSVLAMSVFRLVTVAVVALPVALALVAGGWPAGGAAAVLGFVGLAAVAAAVLGLWYWAPLLVAMVAWLRLRPPYLVETAGTDWLLLSLVTLVGGGAVHVAIEGWRVRRVVRGLDTIRP